MSTHRIERNAASALAALKSIDLDTKAENDVRLSKGTYFSWDTENGDLDLVVSNTEDVLLDIRVDKIGAPQWFTFNLELGECDIAKGDILGVIVDASGFDGAEIGVFFRSATADGTPKDTLVADTVSGSTSRAISTLIHQVGPKDALAQVAAFHTLVWKLPKTTGQLAIYDLRVFWLPADNPAATTYGTA